MRWLDISARVTGSHHAMWRHADAAATLARALDDSIRRGERVCSGSWRAGTSPPGPGPSSSAEPDSSLLRYDRGAAETVAEFGDRLARTTDADGTADADSTRTAGFAVLLRGDSRLLRVPMRLAQLHAADDPQVRKLVATRLEAVEIPVHVERGGRQHPSAYYGSRCSEPSRFPRGTGHPS